jgi:hypothetical protein
VRQPNYTIVTFCCLLLLPSLLLPLLRSHAGSVWVFVSLQQALVQRGEVLKELEDSCAPTNKVMLSRLIRPLWAQLDEATSVYNNVQKALRSQAKQRRQPQ